MTIKAICFDADGVVVNPQKQFSRYLTQEHGISPNMTRGFFEGVFNDCLIGQANLKEVLPAFLRDWGWAGSVDEFIQTWLLTDHVIDERLLKAIHRLRLNGLMCCLTTSQERNRAEYMKTRMGFQDVFDQLFFSCEVGWQNELRPKNWTQKPGFLNNIRGGLLGQPVGLELGGRQIA